jgi:hypothetical protein
MQRPQLKFLPLPAVLAASLATAHTAAGAWQKTSLATTGSQLDEDAFPILDNYGDAVPALPPDYTPAFYRNADGLQFLRVDYSDMSDPPEINDFGFPVLGDYYQLSLATLDAGAWSVAAPLSELSDTLTSPMLVSRNDATVSVAHWDGDFLNIDTIASPSNTRITLQVPKRVAAVAIDANGGVHVAAVSPDYALWHYYYTDGDLTSTKLSSGPVCDVAAVAGEGDACHVAYSTYPEDMNLNGELDDGEDLNGNGILDETPPQLIYQSLDAATPSAAEFVDDDTLLKLCGFDLYFSTAHGVKLAYGDPVANEVRLAERGASSWSSVKASTRAGMFESIALAVNSAGECAIAYVNRSRDELYVAEEADGVWSEALVTEAETGDYFSGTDLAFDDAGQLAVLTSEKNRFYLNLYTRATVPDLLSTLVRPTAIRDAFIITWPTPSEGATRQILQSSTDLSDPESWANVAERNVYGRFGATMETTVEREGPRKFYRVIEQND